MPNKKFLESYPLYRSRELDLPGALNEVDQPAIHMFCPKCGSGQTFRMTNKYHEHYTYANEPIGGKIVRALYKCSSCVEFKRLFFLRFDEEGRSVQKVGQFPPWEIEPDDEVQRRLARQAPLFKKGLISESQGYGIGAFAYYRRIVEEIIDDLLDDITQLIPPGEREEYERALEQTKDAKVASEKIELVKDLLPPILRPNGVNPLGVLYGVLSEGLHGHSDEECLDYAMEVRESIVFLVQQVRTTREASQNFTERMRKLLDRSDDNSGD